VVKAVLLALRDVRTHLGAMNGAAFAPVRSSVNEHMAELLASGWIRLTPAGWWSQLPKYLRAIARRLERARGDVERDRKLQAQVDPYARQVRQLTLASNPDLPSAERERLHWMVEEFRLSLHAQDLRTLMPVSARRLDEQLQLALNEAAGTALYSGQGAKRS
jgi:ATP-dependent helicase HrpA